ncbi:MAG: flagellar biosynthetic protein FliQ [Desulfobacterales bacterium]|nr:flagellar biosynthetic protein FliQ [Desulfobacterales bacterium]
MYDSTGVCNNFRKHINYHDYFRPRINNKPCCQELLISIFQAVTQIQEATLTFVP